MSEIQEAIEEIKQSGLYGNQVHQKTLETALSALQDQAKREKGCEYCNGGIYSMAAYDFEVRGKYMKFCPYCGRDLRNPVNTNE